MRFIRKAILFFLLGLLIIMCDKEPNSPDYSYVIISNEENDVTLKIEKEDINTLKSEINLSSIFMDNGVLVYFDKTLPNNISAELEIFYKDKFTFDPKKTNACYLYQFDDFGNIETVENGELDINKNTIKFKVKRIASFFVGFSDTFFENTNHNPFEYAKYLALKYLEKIVVELENNYHNYSQNEKCHKIKKLYQLCAQGSYFFEEYRLGSRLLKEWLSGYGKANEPIQIPNEYFDNKNIDDEWRNIWEEVARKRADAEYDCSLIDDGFRGDLGYYLTSNGESNNIGIGKYDFYTKGTYEVICSSNGIASFSFNIGVIAHDIVDFNLNSAFKFDKVVCGERILFVIPDEWGIYLRDNCSIGEDYIITGLETFFNFGSDNYSKKMCENCIPGCVFADNFENENCLQKWTVGGRQQAGTNIADCVDRNGSIVGHLFKFSFTEITITPGYGLFPFSTYLQFNFEMEVQVSSTGGSPKEFYGKSGVDFIFYDNIGNSLGVVSYIAATTSYPFDYAASIPNRAAIQVAEGVNASYSLSVNEILSNIEIDRTKIATVKMNFYAYSSTHPNPYVEAELWLDNVFVKVQEIQPQ